MRSARLGVGPRAGRCLRTSSLNTTIRDLDCYLASEYPAVLQQVFEKYQRRLIGVGLHEQLEGTEPGTVTVIDQFPDIETARAFWNDPEYQRIIPIRQRHSDAHVVLLDGAAPNSHPHCRACRASGDRRFLGRTVNRGWLLKDRLTSS